MGKLQDFIDRVLATVPEGDREKLRSDYSAASDEASSLDQAVARVKKVSDDQTAWWGTNKAALEDYHKIKGNGGDGKPVVDENRITKAVDDLREEVLGQGIALVTTANTISASHLHEFGEPLDMEKLAQDAFKNKMTLRDYYNATVAPRRQEREAAARKKENEDAEARGRKAGIEETEKRFGAQAMPFPSRTASPTTLSGLKKPEGGAPDVLAAAVATANEVANRQA